MNRPSEEQGKQYTAFCVKTNKQRKDKSNPYIYLFCMKRHWIYTQDTKIQSPVSVDKGVANG